MADAARDIRSLAWFGGSHFGRTIVWVTADVYAFYTLTMVAGLPASVAGPIFLATMLFSAACDLAVGRALDRKAVPRTGLLISAAIVSSASFAASLVLASPGAAVLSALLFRLAYAIYDVPHNALLQRLSTAATPAVSVSVVRFLTGGAASFLVAGLASVLVREKGDGLPTLALIVAVVGGVTMAIYAPVMARRGDERAPPSSPPPRVNDLWRGASVVTFVAVALLGATLGGLVTKALVFVGEIGLGDAAWAGRALGILTAGRFAAAPLWALAARFRKVLPLTAVACAIVALGGGLMAAAPSRPVLDIAVCLLGAGFGGVTVYSWALLPDLSSAIGRRLGREVIHTTVASYTAINKVALGLSGVVMAALLTLPPGSGAQTLTQALGLSLLLGAAACVGLLAIPLLRAARLSPAADAVTGPRRRS